jgi:hypothetical protein
LEAVQPNGPQVRSTGDASVKFTVTSGIVNVVGASHEAVAPLLLDSLPTTFSEPASVEARAMSIAVNVPSEGSNWLKVTVVLSGSLLDTVPELDTTGFCIVAGVDVTVKLWL